jgi:hypothetical protein
LTVVLVAPFHEYQADSSYGTPEKVMTQEKGKGELFVDKEQDEKT